MENRKITFFSKPTSKGVWPHYAQLRLRLLKHPVSVECCKSHVRFCCLLKWLSGVVPSNWGAIKNYVEWSRAYFSIRETSSKKLKNHSVSTIFTFGTIHLRHRQIFHDFRPLPPSCRQPSALSGVEPSNWGTIKNYIELSRAYFSIWETSRKKLKNHSVCNNFLTFHCLNKLFLWFQSFCKLSAFTSNFKCFSWSLEQEQLFLTVGQNNFGNKISVSFFH